MSIRNLPRAGKNSINRAEILIVTSVITAFLCGSFGFAQTSENKRAFSENTD